MRVITIKVILLLEEREDQGNKDNKRFKQTRDDFLADSIYSMISKALSILAYSKSIAMNHSNTGSISWSLDRTEILYKGRPVDIARFRCIVRGMVKEAEGKL
jgi:hypothetical protein